VWIVGGLVVAIGAIAYLSYHKSPAGNDAAGTIVEAKRARADGTNTFNPAPTSSTTDDRAGDRRATDRANAFNADAQKADAMLTPQARGAEAQSVQARGAEAQSVQARGAEAQHADANAAR
jgi:hypothetical protein